jgi:hypothetical protein
MKHLLIIGLLAVTPATMMAVWLAGYNVEVME